MFDLLTIEEDQAAAALGWSLEYVYDIKTKRWSVQIFPVAMTTNVVGLARTGHPLAIKALRLMATPVTKGKKK